MEGKTVRIYSFSNSRHKHRYKVQAKYKKLLLERCFIVSLDVLKRGDILEFTE